MKYLLTRFLNWVFYAPQVRDRSEHRIHSHKYEDMCM